MQKYLFFYTDNDKGEASRFYFDAYNIPKDQWFMTKCILGNGSKPPGKKVVDAELKVFFDIPMSQNYELIATNNSAYFKSLTGVTSVEKYIGAVLDCKFSNAKVMYLPAIGSVLYNPNKYTKYLDIGIELMQEAMANNIQSKTEKVLTKYFRPTTPKAIKKALQKLSNLETPLTIDVEAFSLKHPTAGLGTISFGIDPHTAIAIPVDHGESYKGRRKVNRQIRGMLKNFFIKTKKQKHIYHNAPYDIKVLCYSLFMDNIIDRKGMLEGLSYLMHNWEDTRIISYLCYNSCDRPDLTLKFLALEYAGNWSELVKDDIKDISKLDNATLCRYNAIDCGATYWVYNKNYPLMVSEGQEELYLEHFKRKQEVIIKAEMTGICVDMDAVQAADAQLNLETEQILKAMEVYPGIKEYNQKLREERLAKENSKRKLQKGLDSIPKWIFNPGSDDHIRGFLYGVLDMPVEHYTDSGAPATNAKAIDTALDSQAVKEEVKIFLRLLAEYNKMAIILSTFIPAFKEAFLAPTGDYYVFGNYNITGTVSGRLSSSDPNLQNMPAHGLMGKLIKECVVAPKGMIMLGMDADSLEDKISALTTKDPNKLAVYIDGMDGHCFNSLKYFPDLMPDIDHNCVKSINSIKVKYPDLRQESKPYTFLLTYQGGVGAMVRQFGISREKASTIYNAFHTAYSTSIEWVQKHIEQARIDGYVTGAFGLKIRTPLLQATRFSSPSMRPYAVRKEEKTAGNGLGQSWCALTDRAAVELDDKITEAGLQEDVHLSMLIHDAVYVYAKKTPEAVEFVNRTLVKAFAWQDNIEIAHDIVKLSGTMSIFHPNWSNEVEVSKTASIEDIQQHFKELRIND